MKYPLGTLIMVIMLASCNRSIFTVEDTYPNGQIKYKGKYILCLYNDPAYPKIVTHEKRKFGKWISYYPNGALKEIRQYTTKVDDCDTEVLKEGTWSYYNQEGVLYLTEQYHNDSLTYSELEVYEGDSLIGKVIKSDFSDDSVSVKKYENSGKLIANPSFDQYYFKPIWLVNDGQDQIESLIPAWYSPDKATPDYYNSHRTVEGVPRHFKEPESQDKKNGYVGLMLQLKAEYANIHGIRDYSESLQTKLLKPLKQDSTYCFRVDIRLSANAGFSINKFGVLFTQAPLKFDLKELPNNPGISFTTALDNTEDWITLCSSYIASGNENYMTIGRFSSPSNLNVSRHQVAGKSQLNVNESAYYLVDKVELYHVADSSACGCMLSEVWVGNPETTDPFANEIAVGDTIILQHLQFEFDSHKPDQNSLPVLERLFQYLKASPDTKIVIMGHTDSVGSDAYNQRLSELRAIEVGKWLINKGINTDRITAKGYGNRYPLLDNSQGAALNRRVEITLTK
ncbi:OmpA family protein [Catalinimonas sp. 4WD22]|uniref:OmpA family protein n=1 Tax=Catalinimonas locisalis TaxID=3133978 RepID=UPI003100FD16